MIRVIAKPILVVLTLILYSTINAQDINNLNETKVYFASLSPNLLVENVDETIEFYETKLGFKMTQSAPDKKPYFWAALKKDNVTIMIQERLSIVGEYPLIEKKETGGTFTLFIRMENVKEFYSQIVDNVKTINHLHSQPYTSAEFAIQDNNGYILTFSEID